MQLTPSLPRTIASALALALVSCGGAPPTPTRAQITAHSGGYADNDQVWVVNPSVRATVPVGARASVHGGYGVDIISAASVDVVASASRSNEVRHEAHVGGSVSLDARDALSATARISREPDYASDGLSLSFDRETASRDRAVHLEARGRWDRVGPGWTLREPADLFALTLASSVTQVLDRRTLLRVSAQGDVLSGLQSSVYRYVPVANSWYPERVPALRVRGAATARVLRSLTPTVALSGEYGLTVDTWGVVANALDFSVRWEPTPWALLDLRARAMTQRGASFYQGTYAALTELRTRDRLLGPMHSLWPALSARFFWPAWPAPPDWELGLEASWLHQRFDDYQPLRSRDAAVGQLWVTRYF